MRSVNFYLKKAEESTGHSLIYLQFKYNSKRLVFTFGETVKPKNWNSAKQRVKSNTQTTADGQHSLNDLLDNLEEVCLKAYYSELKNGIPQPEVLKKHLLAFINQNDQTDGPTLYKLIDRFIQNEIKYQGKDKANATLKVYKTARNHLQNFELKERYPITFESITLDFYYRFVTYLKKLGQKQNTIAKQVQMIKVFMNEAVDLGFTNNLAFRQKKFSVTTEESDSVFLQETEIEKLYKHDFSNNTRLERVRDLFVFGCSTGLRFSDYTDIRPEHIVRIDGSYFIKKVTQKTGELIIVPCSPIVLELFNKYTSNGNKLPNAISNQKFNQFIKEACEAAGLTETGRLQAEPGKPLYECISSHTARRSFATNYYLQGFPTVDLMRITGHRTEKAFLKYIKVSKLDAAKRLSKHIQMRWSEKLLKVAV